MASVRANLSEVRQYDHDSLPVPYCGTGEPYEVYPGNVRTTRYRVSLEVKVDSDKIEEAEEIREKLADLLRGAGIG